MIYTEGFAMTHEGRRALTLATNKTELTGISTREDTFTYMENKNGKVFFFFFFNISFELECIFIMYFNDWLVYVQIGYT